MPISSLRAMTTIRAATFIVGTIVASSAMAGWARAQAAAQPGVGDEARAVLAQMGKTLQAQQFSFQARTLRAYAGSNGELLHIAHAVKAVVRRPDRALVESKGDDGSTTLLSTGRQSSCTTPR